ncbi:MAG: hypothetical protein Q9169_004833 [Polycauliona sp. 2 TL-2023]
MAWMAAIAIDSVVKTLAWMGARLRCRRRSEKSSPSSPGEPVLGSEPTLGDKGDAWLKLSERHLDHSANNATVPHATKPSSRKPGGEVCDAKTPGSFMRWLSFRALDKLPGWRSVDSKSSSGRGLMNGYRIGRCIGAYRENLAKIFSRLINGTTAERLRT